MPTLSPLAMFFQDTATLATDVHSLMIAEWIIAICILLVVLALVGAAIGVLVAVRNVQKKIDAVTKTVQSKATPLIGQGQQILGKVQEIVTDLKPKIASVSGDVTHITGVVKGKVDEVGATVSKVVGDVQQTVTKVTEQVSETVTKVTDHVGGTVTKVTDQVGDTVTQVNSTVQDVNGKTKDQVARVNGIVSEALEATEKISRSVQEGIRVPVDKMVDWVGSAKGGMELILGKVPFAAKFLNQPSKKPTPIRTTTVAPGGPAFVPSTEDAKRPM